MASKTAIFWFKRDLRLSDNKALFEACINLKIIPVYIIEPEYWQLEDSSGRQWYFIRDSLIDLNNELKKHGSRLIIKTGDALEILKYLCEKHQINNIYSNEETGNYWTYQRDLKILSWCKLHNINWLEFPSNGVVRKLKNRDLWHIIRTERMAKDMSPTPAIIPFDISDEDSTLPAKNHQIFRDDKIKNHQKGGRIEGLKTLESFLDTRCKKYLSTISKPGISARHCSRLSPHIAFGTLSIKEIEKATKEKIQTYENQDTIEAQNYVKNLSAFLSRIAWRCHFVQKLEQQPEIEFENMHSAYNQVRSQINEAHLTAWKTGNTGIPIVDSCMRSLIENGWLTFRMRAMLVSFASYNLWQDWKNFAPYLAQLFTDYEAGIHYSQIQMQSGVTGINAIRIYSPIKQSIEHDPEGKFIKRYIPELNNVPTTWIHEPHKMPEILKQDLNLNYTKPIVDVEASTKQAKENISKIFKTDSFKEISNSIHQKLGSRKKASERNTKEKNTKQLNLL